MNKPDRLSDEEFAVIREHPAKGYEILKPVSQLEGSLPGVLHHHERFDGNGYPSGLKGEEIPLIARIIAVADTFDAISSTRAYRHAKSCHQAMSIIHQVSGTQLDPQLVGVFKTIAAEQGYLLENDQPCRISCSIPIRNNRKHAGRWPDIPGPQTFPHLGELPGIKKKTGKKDSGRPSRNHSGVSTRWTFWTVRPWS